MMAMTYAEKLRDPRWQKKRLEVFSKNDFSCEMCGSSEETLHAHHKEYFKGREPWEYEANQLACICASCHKNEHDEEDSLKLISSFLNIDGPNNRGEAASLLTGYAGFGMGMRKQAHPDEMIVNQPDVYLMGKLASVVQDNQFYKNIDTYVLDESANFVLAHPKEFAHLLTKLAGEDGLQKLAEFLSS
jgi:predicted metallo-beta-lactamase superfamily hydrolase